MNEAVTKRFLLYFRLMLLVWILTVNSILHVVGFAYSWLIFLSNIMLFTMEGDIKDRFVSVELGGLVGMVFTVIALLAITFLTPVLGSFFGFLIPLAVVLFVLIILHPLRPQGAQQCGLCLPHGGLHRRRDLRGQPAAVLCHLHPRLAGLQRRVRAADEARQGTGRKERAAHPERDRLTFSYFSPINAAEAPVPTGTGASALL